MTYRLTQAVLTSALILGLAACDSAPAPEAATDADATQAQAQAAEPATEQGKPPISKFKAYTQRFEGETLLTQPHATGHVGDWFFTHWKDGGEASFKDRKSTRLNSSH